MSITGIEQNLPGIGLAQMGLIAGLFQCANDSVLLEGGIPGQPGPDGPSEPGVPDQPFEPGVPTEPDQPPPAPVV
ncbi:hypothetical protein [Pseudomonas sp. RIT-PI-AD]|uniref:hypothetical protein n=1 Tax=Pseudomonas sp. RIT-PI-AD TaxID=3035294 RepID=UPI0021DA8AD2|nr:hypothetical protein [Pseudomonas sp. RIT-PI-AD]